MAKLRRRMIKTYQGRATTRSDVRGKQHEHAIIYTVAQPPRPLRGEERLRQPIGARADKLAQPFSPKTRLNYGQEFEVAHSQPVCPLGHVLERDLSFFVEEYLKVQGKPAERKLPTSPRPRPAPPVEQSHDMSVDTVVTDPPDVLPPDPREEADKALNALKVLPFLDEASAVSDPSGATGPSDVTETAVATEPVITTESPGAIESSSTPEPIYRPATVESDEEGPALIADNQMERPDAGDIKNESSNGNREPDSPHQQTGSVEDKPPLLIEWHEEGDESHHHTAAQEEPTAQESLPVTTEITPAEPEPPDTNKAAEVSALEKDNPDNEAGQDQNNKLNLSLDSSGQKDLDDPVDLLDELPDLSPAPCEPDPTLDVFAFQVDSLLEEVNRFANYVYPTVEDAEDSELAELTREATPIDLSNYQSTPEPFEVLYESINESTYSIETESTPSVSPVVDLKPDWLDDWLQLTPHEIRACVCGRGTTPERSESVHTIATDDKSEGPLTPESTDLNTSTGPTSSYHTPAAEFEIVSANEACEETDKIEVAASDILSPSAPDRSATPFNSNSNEQVVHAHELGRSSSVPAQHSLPSSPSSTLATAPHPSFNLPPSPAPSPGPSPKVPPTPIPPRSCPPEPRRVLPRRHTINERAQEQEKDSSTPQNRPKPPRPPPRYSFSPPQQFYNSPQPAVPMPGPFPEAPGPSMYGNYYAAYQQTPPMYPAPPNPVTQNPTYFARQAPGPNIYAPTPYNPTYSTRCDPYRQQQQQQPQQHQQQYQQPQPQNYHIHHTIEQPRPSTTPEPSDVTCSSSSSSTTSSPPSSSSTSQLEKEVYFYNAHSDKTPLRALLDTSADRNFIRLDRALEAGLELRLCTHLNFWAGDGSVVKPKYMANGRWRFNARKGRGGGCFIWTDEFVVLENMPRDVILGAEVVVERAFLLPNETLRALGLSALALTKGWFRFPVLSFLYSRLYLLFLDWEKQTDLLAEQRKSREEEEKRKRLKQSLETRRQALERKAKRNLLRPKHKNVVEDEEDEWYDCDEDDSSVAATVGSRS